MTRIELLKIYGEITKMAGIEQKGKTMPYTSSNGYMFSLVNKDDNLGIRLSKSDTAEFDAAYGAKPFMSHGAKMREYVLIPEGLLNQKDILSELLKKASEYVNSLPPK